MIKKLLMLTLLLSLSANAASLGDKNQRFYFEQQHLPQGFSAGNSTINISSFRYKDGQ